MKSIPYTSVAAAAFGLLGWSILRKPSVERSNNGIRQIAPTGPSAISPDATLVRSLLGEHLSERTFSFAVIAEACSGKKVLPLDQSSVHQRVTTAIGKALDQTIADLNQPDSPVRRLRRINEASRYFEDGILAHLNHQPGIRCEIPPTRVGGIQRSGYPDLRITDEASGTIFYLDPKLVAQGTDSSTFRSFYFEPKTQTLKITDDAVHLLAGIIHDGKSGQWTFTAWRLVDLSKLRVRLKAEFQASNADLYRETELPQSGPGPWLRYQKNEGK